jgi:serine/threonine protein kinase
MNSLLWEQVNELYEAALERDHSQRAAFLQEACAGNEELRQEIASLLAASESTGILDAQALEVAAQVLAEETSQSLVGRKLGHFKIHTVLGTGGMGEVYEATDINLGRKVAIKLLPQGYTQEQERVIRFKQEARAASALNHPNIITIFEIGELEGLHFIATEFVEGKTLRQMISAEPIKLSVALNIATQIASALAEAHAAGIVHRDIKPENVMVRPDGYVKVLDFGLAKLTENYVQHEHRDSEALTQEKFYTDPGRVMGTPRYMSPEQVLSNPVDGRSDIFSLGVVLYELIAGRPPFEGKSSGEIVAAILHSHPSPLARYARDVPTEMERIVNKTLEKDREQRYQVVKDLLLDLKSLSLELELEAKQRRPSNPIAERSQRSGEITLVAPPQQPSSMPSSLPALSSVDSQEQLEPVGGAVPIGSRFYILRTADESFRAALVRQDSSVLIKGARQVGKTSLLARGLQQARETGAQVVLTDFQKLSSEQMATPEAFYLALAEIIADQLDLDMLPENVWNARRGAGLNFERYLRREVLGKLSSHIVWGLDEVDRLFTCSFGSEVFGLFRSWHNERALDPRVPWQRLTLAMAYATEAHLFITDMNQSPFNVGTRIGLGDFNFEQVTELNKRYGSPLRDKPEVARYFRLVGGHPFLVRSGLHEMVTEKIDLTTLEAMVTQDEGPYGDHLRRLMLSLSHDPALSEVVRGILLGSIAPDAESFFRLRSAGVMIGESPHDVRLRCQLYVSYLERHLL